VGHGWFHNLYYAVLEPIRNGKSDEFFNKKLLFDVFSFAGKLRSFREANYFRVGAATKEVCDWEDFADVRRRMIKRTPRANPRSLPPSPKFIEKTVRRCI
jgi:hypothetical protein